MALQVSLKERSALEKMAPVTLTEKAAQEVKRVLAENGMSPETALRIAVVGGGCSGFEYRLDFDASPASEDDVVGECLGVRVVVDRASVRFLQGTTIDFHDSLMQKGFVFNNPLAVKTCGCGTSFAVS